MAAKILNVGFFGGFLAAAFYFALATSADASAKASCPSGDLEIIRLSRLKSTASLDDFLVAMRAHRQWFRNHGFVSNELLIGRVLDQPAGSSESTVSSTEVMTIHRNPPDPAKIYEDAAWKAFVAKYEASSEIVFERMVCVSDPK